MLYVLSYFVCFVYYELSYSFRIYYIHENTNAILSNLIYFLIWYVKVLLQISDRCCPVYNMLQILCI